jgi:hypothetical protein
VATFAPEVALAVEEINRRFPELGKGGTYPEHGEDEPGGLPSQYYSADFWSTSKSVHDKVFAWTIASAERLNLKYVISWDRIWSWERRAEGVRPYRRDANRDGKLSAGERHTNHLHHSFNESGFYMPSTREIANEIEKRLLDPDFVQKFAAIFMSRDGIVPNTFPHTDPKNTHLTLRGVAVETGNEFSRIAKP